MEVWLRGLIENMIDALFEEGFLLSMKRQADFFAVEGTDKQNLYLGYANGYISGYAHAAIVLLCRREPTDEEQDEIRNIISKRSEEILKKLGII